jgi:hypothetical protein
MNINAGIVDQHIRALAEKHKIFFNTTLSVGLTDETKQRSTAFVLLTVKAALDLSEDEALDCLTEGGNDFGVDAIHTGDVLDGEFVVTLFQGKYQHSIEGTSGFPENGVTKMIQAVRYLFDPNAQITMNPALEPRIEEIRSLIRDGHIPKVHVLLCNNGPTWSTVAQQLIERANFGDQVRWQHLNHDELVRILQATQPVNDTIRLSGKAIVEDFNFRRVIVGRIAVTEIEALFNRHDMRLLERNIRRYLGLQGNRVNLGIQQTLSDAADRANFYFYNNGITLICNKFTHNALQGADYQVRVEGLQVINGGQTCMTIKSTLAALAGTSVNLEGISVLVRLYELPGEEQGLVRNITYATNSQNPVDLRDLRSNDGRQRQLETSIRELGYTYRRQRSEAALGANDISSAVAADAVLSVWRNRPQQAKFQSREHFGKFYEIIFSDDLNGAQTVLATLLFRIAENKRKRPASDAPAFTSYSASFAAMLMGKYLLTDLGVPLAKVDHRNFAHARGVIEQNSENYYLRAVTEIRAALQQLYGAQEISLQRMSATFRRADLLDELNRPTVTPVQSAALATPTAQPTTPATPPPVQP